MWFLKFFVPTSPFMNKNAEYGPCDKDGLDGTFWKSAKPNIE